MVDEAIHHCSIVFNSPERQKQLLVVKGLLFQNYHKTSLRTEIMILKNLFLLLTSCR